MKRKRLRKFRYGLLFYALRCVFFLGKAMPRSVGLSVFGLVGRVVFLLSGKDKKRSVEQLRAIYGDIWDEGKIKRTARDVYIGLGKNLFDSIYLSAASREEFDRVVKSDDLDAFRKAYQNRGGFIITAHIGCFEMLLHFFARHGFKSFAIGKKLKDERIDGLVRKLRSGPNIEYMDRSENGRKILRFLKGGRLCGVLIDQDTDIEGVFAQFLGRPAFTPSGPIRIAMKNNTPVFVATTVRLEDNTHKVFISSEIVLENSGEFERDLVCNVQKVNNILCKTINEYPSQWVWMHRRWKTKAPVTVGRGVE
ncbi:Lipid A biosynthesis lauroyl acyltransferase [Chitinispirillum alkaliphilum]|nr:Lipid A biosynthesis lauroyl acyltransferase [Chitinispirillum alkaliphilum]